MQTQDGHTQTQDGHLGIDSEIEPARNNTLKKACEKLGRKSACKNGRQASTKQARSHATPAKYLFMCFARLRRIRTSLNAKCLSLTIRSEPMMIIIRGLRRRQRGENMWLSVDGKPLVRNFKKKRPFQHKPMILQTVCFASFRKLIARFLRKLPELCVSQAFPSFTQG